MATVPNGIGVSVQYEHLHTIGLIFGLGLHYTGRIQFKKK